ncbi:hypothetical protein [Pantoea sp. C2G6]|uniref:hypothetical protein n=1 Tax=Pantoea sp. C2G6 TaxID=3243084 RepID=UPI003EDAECF6
MTEAADLALVKECLFEFLKKKEIKAKLSFIIEKEYRDWEKWFQIEFESFLMHEKGYRTRRELKAKSDKRSRLNRFYMFVDLIFRKPNTSKNKYIYLEFKRAMRATTLVNGMISDITKVNSIVKSHYTEGEFKQRSFWCVGFYQSFQPISVNRAGKDIGAYKRYVHEPVYLCACRGKTHTEECLKLGVVVI